MVASDIRDNRVVRVVFLVARDIRVAFLVIMDIRDIRDNR